MKTVQDLLLSEAERLRCEAGNGRDMASLDRLHVHHNWLSSHVEKGLVGHGQSVKKQRQRVRKRACQSG